MPDDIFEIYFILETEALKRDLDFIEHIHRKPNPTNGMIFLVEAYGSQVFGDKGYSYFF